MKEYRKIRLSDKRQSWLGKRNTVLHSKPLFYNASLQQKYYSSLYKLFKNLMEETQLNVEKLFNRREGKQFFKTQQKLAQDAADSKDRGFSVLAKELLDKLTKKFNRLFDNAALPLAEAMWKHSTTASAAALSNSLKKLTGGVTLQTSIVSKGLKTIAEAAIAENVALIKTIPRQYLAKIEGAVMRSITTSNGLQYLIPKIAKYSKQTKRQIQNTAYDQTRKAYNSINKQRMMSAGVNKFIWRHSGGGQKPRQDHIKMDGKVYSFDKLPVIDRSTGERGIPGQAINCGCTMEPCIEFENGEKI